MSLRSAVNTVKESRVRAADWLDRILPFPRARHWFRDWRRSRPFWAGIYLLISGGIILSLPLAPLPIMLTVGMAAISGAAIGFIIIVAGLFVWFAPQQRSFIAVVAAVCCAISFVTSNLGGFGIGLIFGLLGSSMAFGWQPPENSAEGRRQAARRRAIVARRAARRAAATEPDAAVETAAPTMPLSVATAQVPAISAAAETAESAVLDPEPLDPETVEEETDPSLEAADDGVRPDQEPKSGRKHRVLPLAMLLLASTVTAALLVPLGVASAQASTSSAAWPTWWPTWPTWPGQSKSPSPSTPAPTPRPTSLPTNLPTNLPKPSVPGTGPSVPGTAPSVPGTGPSAPGTPGASPDPAANEQGAPAADSPDDSTTAPPVISAAPAQETVNVNLSKVTVKNLSADLFTVKGSKYVNTVNGPLKVLVLTANSLTAKAYSLASTDAGPRVTWNSEIVGRNMEVYVTQLDAWVGVLGLPVAPIRLTPDSVPSWLSVPIPLFVASDISMDQVLMKIDISSAPNLKINVLPAA